MEDEVKDDRLVIWFDVDNTLYSASTNIAQAMGERIHAYFMKLGMSHEEASQLHLQYYSTYALALRGLILHHQVDPLNFDRECDGSLPLEKMIEPDPRLRKLFQDIDRTKARVWALTNAYRPHAERVLRILGVDDVIDGLVYCDYADPNFTCKPEASFYKKAMKQANVRDPSLCLFVDDNRRNVEAALEVGWGGCIHFSEHTPGLGEGSFGKKFREIGDQSLRGAPSNRVVQIGDLEELRDIWPHIFREDS